MRKKALEQVRCLIWEGESLVVHIRLHLLAQPVPVGTQHGGLHEAEQTLSVSGCSHQNEVRIEQGRKEKKRKVVKG